MVMSRKKERPLKPKAIVESIQEGEVALPCGPCATESTVEGTINEYPESVNHVDIAADVLLQANPRRVAWYMVNKSSNDIYIGFSNKVSSTQCMLCEADATIGFSVLEAPFIPQHEVWACAAADDCGIYLFEVLK